MDFDISDVKYCVSCRIHYTGSILSHIGEDYHKLTVLTADFIKVKNELDEMKQRVKVLEQHSTDTKKSKLSYGLHRQYLDYSVSVLFCHSSFLLISFSLQYYFLLTNKIFVMQVKSRSNPRRHLKPKKLDFDCLLDEVNNDGDFYCIDDPLPLCGPTPSTPIKIVKKNNNHN